MLNTFSYSYQTNMIIFVAKDVVQYMSLAYLFMHWGGLVAKIWSFEVQLEADKKYNQVSDISQNVFLNLAQNPRIRESEISSFCACSIFCRVRKSLREAS